MAVLIPDLQSSPAWDGMCARGVVIDNLYTSAIAGSGWSASSPLTQHTGTDMEVVCAAGTPTVADQVYTAGTIILTVGAASTTDRWDLAVWTLGTGYHIVAGTPCGTAGWTRSSPGLPPELPPVPADSIGYGGIYVPAGTTVITTSLIVDLSAPVGGNASAADPLLTLALWR